MLSPCWCRPGGGWTLTEQQGGPPRTAPHTPAHHGLELVISVLTSALSSGLQRWQGCCDTTGVEYAGWETARHPNTRPGSVSGLSGATFRYSPVTGPSSVDSGHEIWRSETPTICPRLSWFLGAGRASNEGSRRFHNHNHNLLGTSSLLKASTSTSTFKTLRHYDYDQWAHSK